MRVEIKLPIELEVSDYHEFSTIRQWYRELSKEIKVIDTGYNSGPYLGMAYCGSLKEPENAKMLKDIRKLIEEDI